MSLHRYNSSSAYLKKGLKFNFTELQNQQKYLVGMKVEGLNISKEGQVKINDF